LIVLFCFC
jgi:Ras-related protein Rab-8A